MRNTKSKPLPDVEVLKEYLNYDPETGILTCRKPFKPKMKEGGKVTSRGRFGYLRIIFPDRTLYAHRVIYKMMTGIDPQGIEIDHSDRNPNNNRWVNLRVADRFSNSQNTKVSRNNKCGIKGVYWDKSRSRWVATLMANRKKWSKRYKTKDEAISGVKEMRQKFHGEFACNG